MPSPQIIATEAVRVKQLARDLLGNDCPQRGPQPKQARAPAHAPNITKGWSRHGDKQSARQVRSRVERHLRCRAPVLEGPGGNAPEGHRPEPPEHDYSAYGSDQAADQEPRPGVQPA